MEYHNNNKIDLFAIYYIQIMNNYKYNKIFYNKSKYTYIPKDKSQYKLTKLQDKIQRKNNHAEIKRNAKNITFLQIQTKQQYKHKKVSAIALGLINLNCIPWYCPWYIKFNCDICEDPFIDIDKVHLIIKGATMNKNIQPISICSSCQKNIDYYSIVIKSMLINKIMYMRYILKVYCLQDLYQDIITWFFMTVNKKNIKFLNNIFVPYFPIFHDPEYIANALVNHRVLYEMF